MRILFITSTRLGDAVLSTGLLDYLEQKYPDARFTVACGPVAAGIFSRLPRLDRLIEVEKQRLDLHWLNLWRACVGVRWDLAVDLRGSGLTFFIPARRRVIMRGGRRPGHRLTHLGDALKLSPPPLPVAWIAAEDRATVAPLLPAHGALIALGPTANWDGKVWPAERFVALFEALSRGLPNAIPVVFGGPGAAERAAAGPVLAGLPGAIDLVGRLTLPEVAAALSCCRLFVGNDSGLMHLAASTGIPTLGLFGPTHAAEYAPAGRLTAAVLAEGPRGEAPMEALPVSSVVLAAEHLLARAAL
jgi:heptosyltransferase-3